MIRHTVWMTVTWIRHVPKYELNTVTRFYYLRVATLMTVTGTVLHIPLI